MKSTIFPGDGRCTLRPYGDDFKRGVPVRSVTLCAARKFIGTFLERRQYYSATGGLLWLYERYCKMNGTPYRIVDEAEGGWTITLRNMEEDRHEDDNY